MFKVAIGAGHGFYTAGKRSPIGEREWEFNNKIVSACVDYLSDVKGVDVLRVDDPTGKKDIPLKERTDIANDWGADIYISGHHNAHLGKWGNWGGTETYHFPKVQSARNLAKAIHPNVVGTMGLRDRGIKTANFHVLRETKMDAILIEFGFMDSVEDIKVMRNNVKMANVGYKLGEAIADYAGLKSSSSPKPKIKNWKVGDRATVKKSAKRFATGETIASFVHGNTYEVIQVKSDRVLLDDVMSWFKKDDLK